VPGSPGVTASSRASPALMRCAMWQTSWPTQRRRNTFLDCFTRPVTRIPNRRRRANSFFLFQFSDPTGRVHAKNFVAVGCAQGCPSRLGASLSPRAPLLAPARAKQRGRAHHDERGGAQGVAGRDPQSSRRRLDLRPPRPGCMAPAAVARR
jgi:hypothetical protein